MVQKEHVRSRFPIEIVQGTLDCFHSLKSRCHSCHFPHLTYSQKSSAHELARITIIGRRNRTIRLPPEKALVLPLWPCRNSRNCMQGVTLTSTLSKVKWWKDGVQIQHPWCQEEHLVGQRKSTKQDKQPSKINRPLSQANQVIVTCFGHGWWAWLVSHINAEHCTSPSAADIIRISPQSQHRQNAAPSIHYMMRPSSATSSSSSSSYCAASSCSSSSSFSWSLLKGRAPRPMHTMLILQCNPARVSSIIRAHVGHMFTRYIYIYIYFFGSF